MHCLMGGMLRILCLDGRFSSWVWTDRILRISQAFCFLSSGTYDGQETSDLGLAWTSVSVIELEGNNRTYRTLGSCAWLELSISALRFLSSKIYSRHDTLDLDLGFGCFSYWTGCFGSYVWADDSVLEFGRTGYFGSRHLAGILFFKFRDVWRTRHFRSWACMHFRYDQHLLIPPVPLAYTMSCGCSRRL